MKKDQPPQPVHVWGTKKGEEAALHSKEAGRRPAQQKGYRSARDATSVCPEDRMPIHPDMPSMPPA